MRRRPVGSVRAVWHRARPSAAHARVARPVPIPKDWIKLKKQVLVSVDRAETRVALLEASGTPAASRSSASAERGGAARSASARRASAARKGGKGLLDGYRVAELYIERRGGRS